MLQCSILFINPMLGSKIQLQIIAITTIGVINGKKYALLKNSLPLILLFMIDASIRGIITPKTDVLSAKIIVFVMIFANNGSENISL